MNSGRCTPESPLAALLASSSAFSLSPRLRHTSHTLTAASWPALARYLPFLLNFIVQITPVECTVFQDPSQEHPCAAPSQASARAQSISKQSGCWCTAAAKIVGRGLTIVCIEFLDDAEVRKLLDQLGVRLHLHRLVRAAPRRRGRPAAQAAEGGPRVHLRDPTRHPSANRLELLGRLQTRLAGPPAHAHGQIQGTHSADTLKLVGLIADKAGRAISTCAPAHAHGQTEGMHSANILDMLKITVDKAGRATSTCA